jgi:hypothetical protein
MEGARTDTNVHSFTELHRMFATRLTTFDWMTTSISVRRPLRGCHVFQQLEVDTAGLPYRQRGFSLSIPTILGNTRNVQNEITTTLN